MSPRLFLALLLMTASSATAGPLEDYRWKNRIIVLDFPEGSALSLSKLERHIRREKKAAEERDVVFLHVGELAHGDRNYAVSLSEEERDEIRRTMKLGETEVPTIYLIGKDGTGKAIQRGVFDLTRFWRLIDTMPMRQREMREGE